MSHTHQYTTVHHTCMTSLWIRLPLYQFFCIMGVHCMIKQDNLLFSGVMSRCGFAPLICGASSRKPYNVGEKKYFTFWQIWILQILSFKSIYNLPLYFIARKIPPENDRKLKSCMAQFGFPSIFLTKRFSYFWGFYDLRLYAGNVIMQHIQSILLCLFHFHWKLQLNKVLH